MPNLLINFLNITLYSNAYKGHLGHAQYVVKIAGLVFFKFLFQAKNHLTNAQVTYKHKSMINTETI